MKKVWHVLRFVIAAALLAWLLSKINLAQAWQEARHASLVPLLAAAVLFFLFVCIGNVRWKILLDAKDLRFSSRFLLAVYFAAWFFNNILPTTIGGDVIRVVYTNRPGRGATAFSAAFVDRMVGFVGLFFFALLASLALLCTEKKNEYLWTSLLGFLVVLALTLGLLSRHVYKFLSQLIRRFHIMRLGSRLDRLYAAVNDYRTEVRPLFWCFLLSLFIQAVIGVIWYLVAHAAGGRVPLLYYFLYIPLVGMISMIPVTPGGLGVREASFFAFFTAAGLQNHLTSSQAVTTSVLYLVINTLYGLAGGLVFVLLKKERRMDVATTESDPV